MACRSVEILLSEHRAVEKVLEELEGLIDDFLTNPEVPDAAKQALGNISDYLDRDLTLHIQKEDQALFPALERYLPRAQGPIAVMLHEHEEIAQAHRELRQGIAELEQHPSTGGNAAAQIRDHEQSEGLLKVRSPEFRAMLRQNNPNLSTHTLIVFVSTLLPFLLVVLLILQVRTNTRRIR